MDRTAIPTAPCDDTVGGLPAVTCPQTEPTAYTFDFGARYADAGEAPPDGALALGILDGDGSITPGGHTFAGAIDIASPPTPITGAPTAADVPGSWQTVSPPVDGQVILGLPILTSFGAFEPGDPIWIRLSITDDAGCVITAYVYLVRPLTVADDVDVYASLDGGDTWHTFAVPGGSAPDPVVETFADFLPTCPAARKALAVTPGCSGVPFPVQGVEGGVPVAVVSAGVAELAATNITEWLQNPGGADQVIPAGALEVHITHFVDPATYDPSNDAAKVNVVPILANTEIVFGPIPGFLLPEFTITVEGLSATRGHWILPA